MTTPERDSQRTFTATHRRFLFLRSGGRCQVCGELLTEEWHAHHVIPHAAGGETALANGSALCVLCHLRTHGRDVHMTGHTPHPDFGNELPIFQKDYSWQEESLKLFQTKIDEYYSPAPGAFTRAWVDQVTPSGGKTIGSLKKAGWLIDQDLIDYVVWVVPRNSIKGGFEDDSKTVLLDNKSKQRLGEPHLRIDVELSSGRTKIPRNHHGGVITYQALENMYDYFELLRRANVRLAFVFDEIHHGVEESTTNSGNQWGATAKKCVAIANSVICLTGTPLRSDDKKVAFLDYRKVQVETDDGLRQGFEVVPSFAFTYADGMATGIARKLIFEHFDPWIDYVREDAHTGEVIEQRQQRLSAIKKSDAQRLKRTPFQRDKGDLPEQMLRRAHEASEWMRRKGDPDAAVLVICRDERDKDGDTIEHATETIRKICGEDVASVSHEDPQSRERIQRFKRDTSRWIVAKQMISEGTNIPRIRVVVLLTVPTQRVYWYQLIHRSTRNEADDRLQDALILQVKIDPIEQWAAEVEQEVIVGLDRVPSSSGEGEGASEGPDEVLRGLSAFLDDKNTMLEGDDYTRQAAPAEKIYRQLAPQTKQELWHVLKTLRVGEELGVLNFPDIPPATENPFSVEERARRFWDEGVKAIRQAVAIYKEKGRDEKYPILFGMCKRHAGMGTVKIEDLLASHDDPLGVTQKFYEAARRLVADAKKLGEPPTERP